MKSYFENIVIDEANQQFDEWRDNRMVNPPGSGVQPCRRSFKAGFLAALEAIHSAAAWKSENALVADLLNNRKSIEDRATEAETE